MHHSCFAYRDLNETDVLGPRAFDLSHVTVAGAIRTCYCCNRLLMLNQTSDTEMI